MPVVNHETYSAMLDSAKREKYAFPAFNVTSMATANAVLAGLTEKKSDGIVQVSIGGGQFASGMSVKDAVTGAISIAQHVHLVADRYPIQVALHTDHCQPEKMDSFVYPLIEETAKRRAKGLPNLFHSHMFDGSSLPLEQNLSIAKKALEMCKANEIILEVETGVVGGEEDGVVADKDAKLYTTPEDMLEVVHTLGKGNQGRYMLAATFGNVHGVYKPGAVKLEPKILLAGQKAIKEKYGIELDLVFHGGSGSSLSEIHETLHYGVIKMNIDTDTQYAFTRPLAEHFFKHYDGVLKIDGEVGNKKIYDPRAYLKRGEEGMKNRVMQACDDLKSSGKTTFKS